MAETGDSVPPGFAERMWDEGVTNRDGYLKLAAALLPIVRAEVYKGQAEALRDAATEWTDHLHHSEASYTSAEWWLNRRADTIEKEADQ